MKTIDYINTLIAEKESLKEICKSHVKTIELLKQELKKLKIDISKKDKKILKLENDSINAKMQKEISVISKITSQITNTSSWYFAVDSSCCIYVMVQLCQQQPGSQCYGCASAFLWRISHW
jgi:phage shock protein A